MKSESAHRERDSLKAENAQLLERAQGDLAELKRRQANTRRAEQEKADAVAALEAEKQAHAATEQAMVEAQATHDAKLGEKKQQLDLAHTEIRSLKTMVQVRV